jgi:hypothetical protein
MELLTLEELGKKKKQRKKKKQKQNKKARITILDTWFAALFIIIVSACIFILFYVYDN